MDVFEFPEKQGTFIKFYLYQHMHLFLSYTKIT